jgi:plastocyanin
MATSSSTSGGWSAAAPTRLPIIRRPALSWWPGAGLAAALLALGLPIAAAAGAPASMVVSAGAESAGGHVQLNAFAPHALTIAAGDSVTWRIDSTEFHTIHFLGGSPPPGFVEAGPDGVFLNPAATTPTGGASYEGSGVAGSGLLTKDQTYSLTFPKPGTYEYVCLVHPEMKGSLVVKAAGEATDSLSVVEARRTEEVNAALASRGIPVLMSNVGELPAEGVSAGIAAGAGDHTVMVPRFLPQRVTVKVGDAVTWIWKDPETPHTVTFLGGEANPEVVIPRPQPNGPPRLELNPAVLAPAGDPTDFAGGPLNSGFLDPAQLPPGGGAPTFSVRFTQPGTYEYVCLLHENMAGTIVVEP